MNRLTLTASLSLVLACTAAVIETRDAEAQAIVLESYVGKRPSDAGDLLAPLLAALSSRRTAGAEALRERVESKLSLPGALVTQDHLTTAQRLVQRADKLVAAKRYAEAVRTLPAAVDVYTAQPAAVASDPVLLARAHRALALLAMAHDAVGNAADADNTMATLLRSAPNWQAPTELAKVASPIREHVAKQLAATPAGTLRVGVRGRDGAVNQSAEIFVNERSVGTGTAEVALPAGEYRVLTRASGHTSRVHRAEVLSSKTANVAIDWQLDRHLRSRGEFVGLRFEADADRIAAESKLALAVGKALGAREVIVIGIRLRHGARSIIASVLSVGKGTLLLAAAAPVDPMGSITERTRALADYLAGSPARAGVVPLGTIEGSGNATLPIRLGAGTAQARPRSALWYWSAAGVGTALAVTGVALLVINGNGNCSLEGEQLQCPRIYDTKLLGLGALTSGVALAGAGLYMTLFRKAPVGDEQRAIGLVPTRGGFAVSVSGLF